MFPAMPRNQYFRIKPALDWPACHGLPFRLSSQLQMDQNVPNARAGTHGHGRAASNDAEDHGAHHRHPGCSHLIDMDSLNGKR